jgi:hypothetical protein
VTDGLTPVTDDGPNDLHGGGDKHLVDPLQDQTAAPVSQPQSTGVNWYWPESVGEQEQVLPHLWLNAIVFPSFDI